MKHIAFQSIWKDPLTRLTAALGTPFIVSAALFAAYPNSLIIAGAALVTGAVLSAFAIDLLALVVVLIIQAVVGRLAHMKKPAGI